VQDADGLSEQAPGPLSGAAAGDLLKTLDTLKTLKNFTFGADLSGIPLPTPPEGSSECLARTFTMHFEGARDRLLDHTKDPNADMMMMALAGGSLVVLCLGHMLVTPVLAIVSGLLAFYFAFVVLLITTKSCDVPVWGAAIAAVSAALFSARILRFGFFALGAAVGLIVATEGQIVAFALFPQLEQELRARDWLQYHWVFAAVVAFASGTLMVGQVHTITMLATAMVGAFGLERGLRGILVTKAVELSETEGFFVVVALFVLGVIVQTNLASCARKGR